MWEGRDVLGVRAALKLYRRQLQGGVEQQTAARAHGCCLAALHVDLHSGCGAHDVGHANDCDVVGAGVAREEVVV